ncbi:hypothetical protein LIER_43455 [Lithospermum erythrorhizon]|uniref:Uncharacterized protein n=1 Tax=Lithospermum erythrorhizon TaxID=34254 RepID=A0AAV3Q3U4_LITER
MPERLVGEPWPLHILSPPHDGLDPLQPAHGSLTPGEFGCKSLPPPPGRTMLPWSRSCCITLSMIVPVIPCIIPAHSGGYEIPTSGTDPPFRKLTGSGASSRTSFYGLLFRSSGLIPSIPCALLRLCSFSYVIMAMIVIMI